MLNDQYEPRGANETAIIDVLADTGRNRPSNIYREIGVQRGTAQHWLDRLVAAGWVESPEDGIYDLAYDPREMTDRALAFAYLDHALELDEDAIERYMRGRTSER